MTEETPRQWKADERRARETPRMVRLYTKNNASIRDIMQMTGRSYGTVHRYLKLAGVRFRRRGNPNHDRRGLSSGR